MNKVIVIGGGAAGLMAAYSAADKGATVTVIERRERPARKILVTGKGRCNVTNNCGLDTFISSVPRGGRFLYSAFSSFSSDDTMAFFEKYGVPLKTERGNRVFPKSDKAMDIADALCRAVKSKNVNIVTGRAAELIITDGAVSGVRLEDGREYFADRVIISTGGMSYPATGSTGDGYALAKQAGHNIEPLSASLIPLLSDDEFCRDMQGVSLRNVAVRVCEEGRKKPVYEDFGELLFTHFGISGPTVLSASAHLNSPDSGKYIFHIDLKPALSTEALDARILRDFEKFSNRDIINGLSELLPRKMIPVMIKRSGIDFRKKINQISKNERATLCNTIKDFTVHITGTRPVEEAIITRGGVSLKEIAPKNMESKLCSGLYFAGEVIDADAYTGGFNLQIAFSTGHLAGASAATD